MSKPIHLTEAALEAIKALRVFEGCLPHTVDSDWLNDLIDDIGRDGGLQKCESCAKWFDGVLLNGRRSHCEKCVGDIRDERETFASLNVTER